jgi:hypothetical protein
MEEMLSWTWTVTTHDKLFLHESPPSTDLVEDVEDALHVAPALEVLIISLAAVASSPTPTQSFEDGHAREFPKITPAGGVCVLHKVPPLMVPMIAVDAPREAPMRPTAPHWIADEHETEYNFP